MIHTKSLQSRVWRMGEIRREHRALSTPGQCGQQPVVGLVHRRAILAFRRRMPVVTDLPDSICFIGVLYGLHFLPIKCRRPLCVSERKKVSGTKVFVRPKAALAVRGALDEHHMRGLGAVALVTNPKGCLCSSLPLSSKHK